MAPSTLRKSPTPLELQGSQSSSSITSLASHLEIPSNSDLSSLVTILQDRKALLVRRRKNLKIDESKVLQGKISKREATGISLAQALDKTEEQNAAIRSASVSPTTTTISLAPPTPTKSRSGHSVAHHPSASPAPSSSQGTSTQQSGSTRTKIKIKRDPDREREESESGSTNVASSSVLVTGTGEGTIGRQGSEASQALDADWDDEGPARPGRTYQIKRKRQRTSQARDQDDLSQSEFDSPQPSTSQRPSPHREPPSNGRLFSGGVPASGTASTSSSIKLKLNPTTHTVPMRNDSINASIRRPSILRNREDFGSAMTPMQASQAAMWELPKRTKETFVPQRPISKPIRVYPTRPDEVDVDFSKMDWKERDKERDRIEAAAASALNGGPGPGQAVVKEGTAASRARDRKQDQVAHHIFIQWADAWFRTLTEEDLAWLSSKTEELEAFQNPALGRHYSDVWAEEEANGTLVPTTYLTNSAVVGSGASSNITPVTVAAFASLNGGINRTAGPGTSTNGAAASSTANRSNTAAYLGETPKFDPRGLKDDHLYGGSSEDARGGPFTERLLAALLPTTSSPEDTSETGPTNIINGHGNNNASTLNPPLMMNGTSSYSTSAITSRTQDMAEYEERLRKELKAIDVLGDEQIDWSDRADDEISSTLRKVQRELRKQIRINELRKTKLFNIAMDRMAYQEYLGCLNSVEREIESGWIKRQTQIKKSMQAQKKKKGGSNNNNHSNNTAKPTPLNGIVAMDSQGVNSSSPAPAGTSTPGGGGGGATGMAHSSSSIGFPTSDRGGGPIPPQFSEALLSAMEKRRQLKEAFEPLFAGKPLAYNTPKGDDSIYQDLDIS